VQAIGDAAAKGWFHGQTPNARRVPGGYVARSLSDTLALRALRVQWDSFREEAHEAATVYEGGGGWLLAMTFAQWRLASGAARSPWRTPAEEDGGEAVTACKSRREMRRQLLADRPWRRAVAAHFRGRCGDANRWIDRCRKEEVVAARTAARVKERKAAQAGLQHWVRRHWTASTRHPRSS
jgi:hypothetical protein